VCTLWGWPNGDVVGGLYGEMQRKGTKCIKRKINGVWALYTICVMSNGKGNGRVEGVLDIDF